MAKGSLRFRLRHRAGDTWHPLEEGTDAQPAPGTDRPEGDKRRVFRCHECDLEIVAIGELWQEGTMDW